MINAFATFIADSLKSTRFTVVDVGCSGGLDAAWRTFGANLRAAAFDASVEECARLAAEEANPDVHYVSGFVGLPNEHPFVVRAQKHSQHERTFFQRTSAARILELRREQLQIASLGEKMRNNVWTMTKLADRTKPVSVPETLDRLGWNDVDLLKIDIDGPDFQVLQSLDGRLASLRLLAAQLEVNFYGGTNDTEHVFHNTDRFMRARGFELVGLEVRKYSLSALPSRFAITSPAQTISGRPFQADAFYARDPAGPDWVPMGLQMPSDKLAKLAAIFSIWDQPDSAAELILAFRTKLQSIIDIDKALDLLAAQAQRDDESPVPYPDYIAQFEQYSPRFFPPVSTPAPVPRSPTFGQRLRAAWQGFLRPMYG